VTVTVTRRRATDVTESEQSLRPVAAVTVEQAEFRGNSEMISESVPLRLRHPGRRGQLVIPGRRAAALRQAVPGKLPGLAGIGIQASHSADSDSEFRVQVTSNWNSGWHRDCRGQA
jgi:hypothetical protein